MDGEPRTLTDGDRDRPAPGAPLPPGTVVGRYVLGRRLGAGASGVVYEAEDPELQRRVAVKLLHPTAGLGQLRERLRREARALASLSHPNLVAVYDVGDFADTVFLALELVAGPTLHEHLAQVRTWRELKAPFLEIGGALAAAHRAGLVHRDVKPDNVLLDGQGRAHLADLGLATRSAVAGPAGTRGFIAPEVALGLAATAASDQWSFCATLQTALAASGANAPRHVLSALRRGLSAEPSSRFPTMEQLLEVLGPEGERRRRRTALALGTAAACLLGLAAAATHAELSRRGCEAGPTALAGVWDPAIREAARAALGSSEPGDDRFANAAAVLDAFADAWGRARTQVCLRGLEGEAPQVQARRVSCLDEGRTLLELLGQRLSRGGPALLDRAAYAAYGLPPTQRCLGPAEQLPDVEPVGPGAAAARSALYDARVLYALGQTEPGIQHAASAVKAAREGGHVTLEAEALSLQGFLEADAGRLEAADKSLFSAYVAAQAAHADELAVRILSRLVFVSGYLRSHFDEARRWAALARATLGRAPQPRLLEGQLENDEGLLALGEWRLDDAVAHFRKAQELKEATLPPRHPDRGMVLNNLGLAYRSMGRSKEALAPLAAAVERRRETYGTAHRTFISALSMLGATRGEAGDVEGALNDTSRAVELGRRFLAPASLGALLHREGMARLRAGECKRPEALLRESVEVRTASLGARHGETGEALATLGEVLLTCGRPADALEVTRQALEAQVAARGAQHPATALMLGLSTEAAAQAGRFEQARATAAQASELLALPTVVRAAGADVHVALGAWAGAQSRHADAAKEYDAARALAAPGAPVWLRAVLGAARARTVLGQDDEAAALAEEARRDRASTGDTVGRAESELVLSEALWRQSGSREHAVELARAARLALAPLERGEPLLRRFPELPARLTRAEGQ